MNKRHFVSAAAGLLLLGLGPSVAAADEEIPRSGVSPSTEKSVLSPNEGESKNAPRGAAYGYQILLTDLTLVVGGVGVSAVTQSPVPGLAAGVGFFTVSPVIHAAHGRGDLAGTSVLIRVLSPVVGVAGGAALGALLLSPAGSYGFIYGGVIGGGVGGGVGIIAATCIDAGRDPREHAPEPAASPSLRAQPTVAVSREGVTVGVLGAF